MSAIKSCVRAVCNLPGRQAGGWLERFCTRNWMPSLQQCKPLHRAFPLRMPNRLRMGRFASGSCVALWIFPMSTELFLRRAILGGAFTYTARPDPVLVTFACHGASPYLSWRCSTAAEKKSNFQKLQFSRSLGSAPGRSGGSSRSPVREL